MFQWISENKEWIFSGIGITIASFVLSLLFKKKFSTNQIIGNNSTGIQAGRDVNLMHKDGEK